MPFEKGNSFGRNKTGKKFPKVKGIFTKIQLRDINRIDDLMRETLENWNEFLTHPDIDIRFPATMHITKFLFPTRKEVINANFSFEDFLETVSGNHTPKDIPFEDQLSQEQPEDIPSPVVNPCQSLMIIPQ